MYFLILWSVLNLFNSSQVPFHGTYSHFYGKDANSPYQMIQIHYVNSSKILFHLEIGRGAPSYNSGALYGQLIFNKRTGNYEYIPKDLTAGCKLEIIKQAKKLTIKTVGGDCGFGHAVYADGMYELKDGKNPEYFISRTDKKVYFEKTTPENFSE
jgi:hypothetical protein